MMAAPGAGALLDAVVNIYEVAVAAHVWLMARAENTLADVSIGCLNGCLGCWLIYQPSILSRKQSLQTQPLA